MKPIETAIVVILGFINTIELNWMKPFVMSLGVTLNPVLSLDIVSLVGSCFYHVKNIAKLNPIVSPSEMEMLLYLLALIIAAPSSHV